VATVTSAESGQSVVAFATFGIFVRGESRRVLAMFGEAGGHDRGGKARTDCVVPRAGVLRGVGSPSKISS